MNKARGNFYAQSIRRDGQSGRSYGDEVGRQLKTLAAARARIDARGTEGHVQYWSERTQQRIIVAERHADGSWWTISRLTGERTAMS